MANPNTQSPAMAADTLAWWTIRGAYRFAIRSAMDGTLVSPSAPTPGACDPPVLYGCNYLNEGFVNVNVNNPENQAGSWPPSDELNQQIGQAFTDKAPASTTIPLQLQANTLEGYRRALLHKKWRKCQHLQAVNAGLEAEPRSQDELEGLLLGRQVGNSGRPAV